MLANIISLVSGCVTFLGGFVVVWGAVSLAAAVYFGQLDTSWMPS